MQGWIKLHRKMVNWEWYTDTNVKVLFLHLLLTVNHTAGRWQGMEVAAGETITSVNSLSQQCGLTVKQVRTALEKLERTGDIERKTAKRFTRIKLLNYCVYQSSDTEEGQRKDKQKAIKGQTIGKQMATNNNDNNKKNDNNDNIYNQNKINYYSKNKINHLSRTPSFDIAEIEYRAMFDDDYDI